MIHYDNMQVMPPGMEFHHIVPHDGDMDVETDANEDNPASPDPPIWPEVFLFLQYPTCDVIYIEFKVGCYLFSVSLTLYIIISLCGR